MIRLSILVTMLATAIATPGYGQQTGSDPRFGTPDVPGPTQARNASGRPTGEYWQQRADYTIRVSLDPGTNSVTGEETIHYTNNSPDTLAYVWVQLEQNLFAPGSRGAQTYPQGGRFGGGGFPGGYAISRVAAAGADLEHRIVDTQMRVELAVPLGPGASMDLDIDWRFRVPDLGADRMGHDGEHYVIAQWYPRITVYDDVEGWNTMPYLGQGEFYLEYGDFEVLITVPARFLVGATGELSNPEQVLTAGQIERLTAARTGDEVVHVVTADELQDPTAYRPETAGTLTWRYTAQNVRDFVWTASPWVLWDATAAGDVLVHALYRPDAPKVWTEAATVTKHSIEFYSEMLTPYPWPTATAVEGPVFGMEYPMVVYASSATNREELFDVLDHEWSHMWFPMIVGTDERRYPWMDEGFATYANQYSKQAYFPETDAVLDNTAQYVLIATNVREQPVADAPDLFTEGNEFGLAAYVKPGVMLTVLRAYVGDDAFEKALRAYVNVWAYRHPQPADFFRLMQDELGEELGWFWYNWIYTTGTSDMAILGVDQGRQGDDDRWRVTVTVDTRSDMLMPARVVAETADGQTATVTIPVQAFHLSDRATATLWLPGRAERIVVNEGPEWGDINPRNNVWER